MKKYTFTLRTQPDQGFIPCEDCTVTVEQIGNVSLYDLAVLLIEGIGFDFDHAFGFYDNLKNPYRSQIGYSLFADMGEGGEGELGVQETRIDEVFGEGTKMILLFDYGDDWFFVITCEKIEETKGRKPSGKVVSVEGTPPEQYPGDDDAF